MGTSSLLNPSTSLNPSATPQGGMLFGRLAEQSPLTDSTLCVPQALYLGSPAMTARVPDTKTETAWSILPAGVLASEVHEAM